MFGFNRHHWLPPFEQIRDAVQFRLHEAIAGDDLQRFELEGRPATTVQQSIGLVTATALIAGLLPFFVNWLAATARGTSVVMLQIGEGIQIEGVGQSGALEGVLVSTLQILAGLEPVGPGWLAALLSALGIWLSGPFTLLTYWLVYGLGVLLAAKLFGAGTTLQQFLAATGYAFAPLALLSLAPLPIIGAIATIAGISVAIYLYIRAVQIITRLSLLHALVCTVAPALIGLGCMMLGMVVLTAAQLGW